MDTVELTGNPGLTGPLPDTLQESWLNVLKVRDLHDNNFSGLIPNLAGLCNLLQLDLSGNHFTGGYPFNQLSTMNYLQKLSIGDNHFTGEILVDAFTNNTELEMLDISENSFTGAWPDLDHMNKLIYLNLGRNEFTGTANLLDIFDLTANSSALAMVDLFNNR